MRLVRLAGSGFRNLEDFDIELDPGFTVLYGANAQGKTNTLEAIWYVASLKPLRARSARELTRWGGDGWVLAGSSVAHDIETRRRIEMTGRQRTLLLDGKKSSQLGDYFQGIRAIAFQPADVAIVRESPENRRRWVDRAAFTARPVHLDLVRAYQRVLSNKGAALRADRVDRVLLDSLDDQLVNLGAELAQRRADLLDELRAFIGETVAVLAGAPVQVEVRLATVATGDDVDARRAALRVALHDARSDEIRRQRTLVGVQTDDVRIKLVGRSARSYASQGQVRTLVLALKLAELKAARERGSVPLFLLDDLSSELDRLRTGHLIGLLQDLGAQVVATTTDPEHLAAASGRRPLELRVENGVIRR